jgi:hypothetical protein
LRHAAFSCESIKYDAYAERVRDGQAFSIIYDVKALLVVRMNDDLAVQWVSGVVRSEMKRRGLNYVNLMDRLDAMGVKENERNLRNKVARGTFSAVFFVQCLEAMGVKELQIDMAEVARNGAVEALNQTSLPTSDELKEMEKVLARLRAIANLD